MKFVFLTLVALFAGCASPEIAARSPQGKLLQSAVRRFGELKQQDRLPGIRREEHGSLTTEPMAVQNGDVSYPASVTIRAKRNGDVSEYRYVLRKETPDSPWELVKALRFNSDGKLVEELSDEHN